MAYPVNVCVVFGKNTRLILFKSLFLYNKLTVKSNTDTFGQI